MSLTASQRAAATAPGSVAITAGAGSGKTHVLSERIIHLLEGGLPPLALCAVTFTEAAALELRTRIEGYAQRRLETASDPVDIERWEVILDALDAMQVSTIHSLCARIAREHPAVSKASLEFRTLEGTEHRTWMIEHLREAMNDVGDAPFELLPARTVFEVLETLLEQSDDALRAFAAVNADSSDSLVAQWAVRLERERDMRWTARQPDWERALEILRGHGVADANDTLEIRRRGVLSAWSAGDAGGLPRRLETVEAALHGWRTNAGSRKVWGDGLEVVRGALKTVKEIAADDVLRAALNASDDWLAKTIFALRDAYTTTLERIDAQKTEAEVLGFSDLLRAADRALEQPEVRRYYAKRFKAVLIDEFQDTSPIQWRVLSTLAQGANLTVVGDEKQSIYGFSGARVALFHEARRRILEQGGLEVSLRQSFRSHDALVGRVNATFASVFEGGEVRFEALEAERTENPAHPLESVELHLIAEDAPLESLRRAEAQLIARRIHDLIASARPIHDKTRGTTRPVRLGDIAVLFRSRTDLHLYEDALAAAGIAFTAESGGLLERREVRDARALLEFLENPTDDLALVTTLRSPWFAVSDDDLMTLARNRETRQAETERHVSLFQASTWDASAELRFARTALEDLLEHRHLSLDQLLMRADDLTGFSATLALLEGGRRRVANFNRFTALLREWQSGSRTRARASTLSQLRQTLADFEAQKVRIDEASGNTEDAVRLVTLHGSKGLEYPVVIIADLTRLGRQGGRDQLLLDPEQGLALKPDPLMSPDDTESPPIPNLWRWLERSQAAHDDAETNRLCYVGFTRARDLLILTSAYKTPVNAPSRVSKLEQLTRAIPTEHVKRFQYAIADIEALIALERPRRRLELRDPMGALFLLPDTLPVTALREHLDCPKRFKLAYLDGLEPIEREWRTLGGSEEKRARAVNVGTMVHRALELELEDLNDLTRIYPGVPLETLEEVAALMTVGRNLTQPKPEREIPFSLEVSGVTLEGVIDAIEPSGRIVDYKTDRSVYPEHHLVQLALYARTRPGARAALAYLRHQQAHEFSSADLERGWMTAGQVVERMKSGLFDATPSAHTCRTCVYRYDCADSVETAQ